jgi:hypothetical protein
VSQFGSLGTGDGQFNLPSGICLSSPNLQAQRSALAGPFSFNRRKTAQVRSTGLLPRSRTMATVLSVSVESR